MEIEHIFPLLQECVVWEWKQSSKQVIATCCGRVGNGSKLPAIEHSGTHSPSGKFRKGFRKEMKTSLNIERIVGVSLVPEGEIGKGEREGHFEYR